MKKRILSAALILVLALGVVFTVVGCGTDLEKTYKSTVKESTPYAAATKIAELDGFSMIDDAGNYVLLKKENGDGTRTYKVFNFASGSVILSKTVETTAYFGYDLYEVGAVGQAVLCSHERESADAIWTRKLYDATGAELGSAVSLLEASVKLDLVKLGDVYYRVGTDGSIVKAFELHDLTSFSLDELKYKSEKYYYAVSGSVIYMFDLNCKLVSSYTIPGDAVEYGWFVLENGNLFVQEFVAETVTAEKYDIFVGGNKFTVEQKVVNPKNGDVKDVKDGKNLVYVYRVEGTGILYDFDDGFGHQVGTYREDYAGSVDNYAVGFKVIDKKLDDNEEEYFDLSGSGKLSEIEDIIPAQGGVFCVGEYYLVSNKIAQQFLYDKDGKLIGEVTNAAGSNAKFIYTDKAVYDYKLNKVMDLGDYVVDSPLETTLILAKENGDGVVEYFLLKEGSDPVKIADETNLMGAGDKYYIVMNGDGKFDCYNEVGTKLLTLEGAPDDVTDYNVGEKLLVEADGSIFFIA